MKLLGWFVRHFKSEIETGGPESWDSFDLLLLALNSLAKPDEVYFSYRARLCFQKFLMSHVKLN